MSAAGTELNLNLLGAEVGELPETAAGGQRESIDNDESKVTLGLGSGEDQDRSGSLTSLEQELLTLEAQPQDAPQMLSSALAGSSVEQAIAAEEVTPGEGAQAGQVAGRGSAGGQGPEDLGAPDYPHAAMQAQEYGPSDYNHYGGQVKMEDDIRRVRQEGPADSGAPGEAGAGGKRPLEGAGAGLVLSRQSTEESLGRHMEGGREGEDGGTEGEEQEGRGQGNKKQRLVWTAELHSRFMNAVNHLGVKNAVPKTILQLMNVEGMTRENVASHLQKYRLYLKRLAGLPPNARLSPELVQGGSHLYPYVHQPHEVPPPMMMPPPPLHQGYAPHGAPYYPPPHRPDTGGPPLMGSPAPAPSDASASGPKPGEGRSGEAGAPPYPGPVGSIPPSPPHFGYTPEMYSSFSSMAHAGWHPLPGPGPGQPAPGQYRAADALPGSPAPPGQGAHFSSPGAGHYSGPVGGPMYGAGAGVGSPAPLQGSPYGYQGGGGAHYSSAAMGSPAGTGSPPSAQRGSAPPMLQYPAPTWQQEPPGGGFSQQFWMPPAAQDWQQKRWPDAGQPQQRKW